MKKSQFMERLRADLLTLGVRPGGVLLVHSSLQSFGLVPGGAETVIQGLLAAVGENGTLLMPALTYETVTPKKPVFDLKNTPSCVGLIPETFRTYARTKRSRHPTHSVCGIGPLAGKILNNHARDTTPCGPNSPFHKLPGFGGQILMLGCGLKPNTSMHAIEEMVVPPYLFNPPITYFLVDQDGQISGKEYVPHNFKGWAQRYDRLAEVLFEPDLHIGFVAGAKSHLIEAKTLWDSALKACRNNPLFFVEGDSMDTTHGFVTTNGIKIHYERTGGSQPPFILCHGITDNGRCMLRLAEHLAPNYNVILVDARGHGLSDGPDTGYSADHHADDLMGLIRGLGLDKPILYGHSMGALTIVRLAAKHPEIPRAVILEDPPYITPLTAEELIERDKWLAESVSEVEGWKAMTFDEHLENAKSQGHPDWTAAGQIEWAKSKPQVRPQVFKIIDTMHHIRDDFPLITCPVLIVKADAEPEIRAANQEAAALIPNGRIIHVRGAGHNVRRDNWPATVSYLDEFLNSL